MSFLSTLVAGDITLSWSLLRVINVGKSHSIGSRCTPTEAIFLLPVGDNVVRSDDGHRVVVATLEEVVLKVLDQLAVASPVAPEQECNGGGTGKRL